MRRRGGFTLVEMLIVVAVIAILILIAIPVFSAQLERVRKATCDGNLESCIHLLYAQEMTDGGNLTTDTMTKTLETGMDATPAGSAQHYEKTEGKPLCPDGGEYVFAYSHNRHSITGYCTEHGGSGGLGGGTDGKAEEMITGLINAYNNGEGVNSNAPIDSTAPNDSRTNKEKILQAAPALAGIFNDLNVKTWALRKEGGHPIVWFTDVDITTRNVDDRVRVIRYNANKDTYTAGYMVIQSKTYDYPNTKPKETSPPYNVLTGSLGAWDEASGQNDGTKASYEQTLAFFNDLAEVKSD